jgi:YlmC/YmxH family sporulation protein
MELNYSELKKRDVINVADGRCLGRITDIRLDFPEGILVGITVPGRKTRGLFRFFDKSEMYIDESRIIKIGGDVILVDLSCGETCDENTVVGKKERPKPPCPPPCNPCPPCPPPCNPCSPCSSAYPINYPSNSRENVASEINFDEY